MLEPEPLAWEELGLQQWLLWCDGSFCDVLEVFVLQRSESRLAVPLSLELLSEYDELLELFELGLQAEDEQLLPEQQWLAGSSEASLAPVLAFAGQVPDERVALVDEHSVFLDPWYQMLLEPLVLGMSVEGEVLRV